VQFFDRAEAGRQLADRLQDEPLVDPMVLGLPRGGIPVAFEVATRLGAPLDVFVARKISVPSQPELGIGAIAGGGTVVLTRHLIDALGISEATLHALTARAREEPSGGCTSTETTVSCRNSTGATSSWSTTGWRPG
jgi:putative phosphoribosyl transferase